MPKYVYVKPQSSEDADRRIKELCTEEFLNALAEVACLFAVGDYTETAKFVEELHRFAGKELPVMPDWPEY